MCQKACAILLGLFCVIGFPSAQEQKQSKEGDEPDNREIFANWTAKNPAGLRLELSVAKTTLKALEKTTWTAELINDGKENVTLVKLGDGSESIWRTAAYQWSIDRTPPRGVTARCGNINPLRPNEVFTLKPGQRVILDGWLYEPPLATVGKHRVSLRYANIPNLQWQGLPLGRHDEKEMAKVKNSTPVNLVSNEIVITIVEAPK